MAIGAVTGTPRSTFQSAALAYGGAIAICFVLAWIVSLAWWLLLPSARTVVLDVPRGTAAAVARGERPSVIPSTLLLRRGDTLAIRNEDVVAHSIGLLMIAPGTTARIPVDAGLLDGPPLLCSIHPSGALSISALARPGIEMTVLPTLLAGVPTAMCLLVAIALVRRLDRPEHG